MIENGVEIECWITKEISPVDIYLIFVKDIDAKFDEVCRNIIGFKLLDYRKVDEMENYVVPGDADGS